MNTTLQNAIRRCLILLGCSIVAAGRIQAQGTVNFANSSTSLVVVDNPYALPWLLPSGPAPVDADIRVALYWLNGGTWSQIGSSAPLGPVAGRFAGGIRGNSSATPGTETFKVVAWQGGSRFPTYESALAGGLFGYAAGESASFSNPTGGGTTPPAPLSGFAGLAFVIPEPSTVTLLLVGGALVSCWRVVRPRGS